MQPNNNNQTGIKQKLCTVTPFSKLLALILFIALPFIGFWLGRQYPAPPAPVSEAVATEDAESETTDDTETAPTESATGPTTNPPRANTTTPAPTPSVPTGPSEVTVYISEITLDTISVDNIGIYEGNSAIQQMIADGLCTAAEPQKCTLTSGVYYRNTDPTIRTYPLLDNVVVQTWTGGDYALSKMVNRAPNKTPYIITISNGYVIKIKEVYQP